MAEETKAGGFCPECGAKIEGAGKFCTSCGAPIGAPADEEEKKPEEKVEEAEKKEEKAEKKPEKKEEKAEKKPEKKEEKKEEKKPASASGKKKKADVPRETNSAPRADRKSADTGLRIAAFVLWALAIGFEILTILLLNGTLYIPGNLMTWLIVGIVLDLICVVIGSLLWKKANRIDPASRKDKARFFLQNQLGVIMAVIAFLPLIIILFRNKNLDPKVRKILTVIACIALVAAGLLSADFDPPSEEDLLAAESGAYEYGDGSAYWTRWGKSYHFDEDCQTLRNSEVIYNGTVAEAFEAKRDDPCDFCAGGGELSLVP